MDSRERESQRRDVRAVQFAWRWCELAEAGLVDEQGGAEYRRVFLAYHAAGYPEGDLVAWIVANR